MERILKLESNNIGSLSKPDTQNKTSLSVSVSDLKQKMVGIEEQLNTVSEHCHNLASLGYNLRSKTMSSDTVQVQNNIDSGKDTIFKEPETTVFYNTTQDCWRKSNKSRSRTDGIERDGKNRTKRTSQNVSQMNDQNYSYYYKEKEKRNHYHEMDPIQECEQPLCSRKNNPFPENLPTTCPIKGVRSGKGPLILDSHPDNRHSEVHGKKKRYKNKHLEIISTKENNLQFIKPKGGHHKSKNHKNKYVRTELDQEFIADIIRRQYRPVTLFGRRDSDFSQFSAPICRDQEFLNRVTYHEESELCSCCHKDQKHSGYTCSNDLSDVRSICDTRLYSSRRDKHHTNRRKRCEEYNDSAMYDIIPVKEKSSPKSRRKFVEDNMLLYDKYKEVPPSPRTQRPRLNLQVQLHTDNDDEPLEQSVSYKSQRKSLIKNDCNVNNIPSEVFKIQKSQISKITKPYNHEGAETEDCMQCPIFNEHTMVNNDTTLNTQITDMSADKAAKTLSEIKDILENFLLEIKKEPSLCDKLDATPQSEFQKISETKQQMNNRNSALNSGQCFNTNNSFGQYLPPLIQPMTNPCCYPILPVCPMNCMTNGFVGPTQSCTCATCENKFKERTCGTNDYMNKTNCSEVINSETQKLIQEIHKLISQNPNSPQKDPFNINNSTVTKKVVNLTNTKTSNSVGGSTINYAGTLKMKMYSKSCEAIVSQVGTDRPCTANICYSDTVFEKRSGEEATTMQSSSESDYSIESRVIHKKKVNKFSRLLKSIGLLRKNKNDIVDEQSESDSSMEVNKLKPRPPFQQHIINYNMHGQEYLHGPPLPTYSDQHQHEYYVEPPHYKSRSCNSPTHVHNKLTGSHGKRPHAKNMQSQCVSPQHMPMPPCAIYYDTHYGNVSPPIPLCLKEIEVKSIGTQSVRKISLLEKITNKMQAPGQKIKDPPPKEISTRTSTRKDKSAKNLFDWKKMQANAMQNTSDPFVFSHKTQKKLADGDIKIKNAILKKLFYKRNPFSPRKLLVRTLLGKDKSSFGAPPKMYKPRMFL